MRYLLNIIVIKFCTPLALLKKRKIMLDLCRHPSGSETHRKSDTLRTYPYLNESETKTVGCGVVGWPLIRPLARSSSVVRPRGKKHVCHHRTYTHPVWIPHPSFFSADRWRRWTPGVGTTGVPCPAAAARLYSCLTSLDWSTGLNSVAKLFVNPKGCISTLCVLPFDAEVTA